MFELNMYIILASYLNCEFYADESQWSFPCTSYDLCVLLCLGARLILATVKMAATMDMRAAAVLIMPLGCSISFLQLLICVKTLYDPGRLERCNHHKGCALTKVVPGWYSAVVLWRR